MTDSRDHDSARIRDLRRLRELLTAHIMCPADRTGDVLARMTPRDQAEARTILTRLGTIGEPPETIAARRKILLNLAQVETGLHDILASPTTTGHGARAVFAKVAHQRARLAGLPADEPATGE